MTLLSLYSPLVMCFCSLFGMACALARSIFVFSCKKDMLVAYTLVTCLCSLHVSGTWVLAVL
jgi:hypothetical protein